MPPKPSGEKLKENQISFGYVFLISAVRYGVRDWLLFGVSRSLRFWGGGGGGGGGGRYSRPKVMEFWLLQEGNMLVARTLMYFLCQTWNILETRLSLVWQTYNTQLRSLFRELTYISLIPKNSSSNWCLDLCYFENNFGIEYISQRIFKQSCRLCTD